MIILKKGDTIELSTTLTKLCLKHNEFSYHYLKRLKFPFLYKGYEFTKQKMK